jgi:hypothetical protein
MRFMWAEIRAAFTPARSPDRLSCANWRVELSSAAYALTSRI